MTNLAAIDFEKLIPKVKEITIIDGNTWYVDFEKVAKLATKLFNDESNDVYSKHCALYEALRVISQLLGVAIMFD